MYQLKVKTYFDAAHYIKDYVGKCSQVHGHRWTIEVEFSGKSLNDIGMLIDFREVKHMLGDIVERHLDHQLLNDTLGEDNLTAEWLAAWLYTQVKARLYSPSYCLDSIAVWESPDCGVKYSE